MDFADEELAPEMFCSCWLFVLGYILKFLKIFLTGNAGRFPALLPDQVRKLKQLSVLTLAENNKVVFFF